ncbi:hypothetical protein CP08DC60_1303 [Chlamydia psittaci 08DC60]|nr:hypothetical protein CP08DC60_1303 [Chlamydia psittaci 08DC60]
MTVSNQTRPVETGFDWLNPVLTGSNHSRPAKTGFHWLKQVLI